MVILDIDGQKYAGNSYVDEENSVDYIAKVEVLAQEIAETVLIHYGLTGTIDIRAKEIEYLPVGSEIAWAKPAVSVEEIEQVASLADQLGITPKRADEFVKTVQKLGEPYVNGDGQIVFPQKDKND